MSEFNNNNVIEIANMLEKATQNVEKVFNSGRTEGYDHGYQDGEADAYNRGHSAGKEEEKRMFWDAYLNGNVNSFQYLFYSSRWNDRNFYPCYDIKPVGSAYYAFSSHTISNFKQRLLDCGVTLDTSKVTGGNYMFAFCSQLTHLPTISLVGLTDTVRYMFADNRRMVEIEKIILKDDGSTTFENWFRENNALTTIAFEGVIGQNIDLHWSTNLSGASIENIINHLSDAAEGKTLTLSKAAVDTAFSGGLSVEDFTTPTEEGSNTVDWFNLYLSKALWTITLV